MIINAPAIKKSDLQKTQDKDDALVPNVPQLLKAYERSNWSFVQLSNSESPFGNYLWNVMLRGEDCRAVSKLSCYVGSSMKEFMNAHIDIKKRLLWTWVQDKEEWKQIPYGDPLAPIDAEWRVMHGWFGRDNDLNFRKIDSKGEITREVLEAKAVEVIP